MRADVQGLTEVVLTKKRGGGKESSRRPCDYVLPESPCGRTELVLASSPTASTSVLSEPGWLDPCSAPSISPGPC